MEQLVKMVSEKTGISESQAKIAVSTVVTFLKDKLPAGLGTQVDSIMKGGNISNVAGDAKEKISNIFGK